MKPGVQPIALVLALLVAAAVPIRGSVIPTMSLEELVAGADAIVDGRVENVESRWEDRSIFTYVTIRVDDPMKGRRSRTVLVRQPGGRIGNLVLDVAGSPSFLPGERVVVFLGDSGNGTFHVVGMAQGRFLVHNDSEVAGLAVSDVPNTSTAPRGMARSRVSGLEPFKDRIRELVR